MPSVLQLRRGTTSQNNSFTGAIGELSYDTEVDTIRVHDGSTAGGFAITSIAGTQTLTNKTLTSPIINTGTFGTSILPVSADGTTIGSASKEFSDVFLADAATIQFGNDQDVILTHVQDTGLLLSGTNVIQFNDASQNIGAPSNAILDINATDEIELNATLVDINANVEISGTATTTGVHTFTATPVFSSDITLSDDLNLTSDGAIVTFGANSEIALTHVHDIGLLLTDSGGSPTLQFTDSAESVSSDGSKLILTSNSVAFSLPTADGNSGQFLKTDGNAVLSFDTVSSAADDISAGDAAVTITTSSGNITIDAAANNSDFIVKGTDGGADITMATFSGADAGTLILNHDLELGTDGSIVKFGANNEILLTHVHDVGLLLTDSGGGPTLQLTDANESISSDGSNLILTSGGTAFTIPATDGDDGQVLATNGSGVLSFATASANTPSSADGQALGSASLEWSDLFLADGGTVTFGNDQDVVLTHIADTGLTLSHAATADNKPVVLQLKSSEAIVVANEVIASLEFAATDSDGTDGAGVAAGIHAIAEDTFSATANATKLAFTCGVSETAAASATAKMTLSSAGLLTIADDFMIKDGGTIGVASVNDAITISSGGIVTFKDDILIKDGGTIGSASAATAITISSGGIVTLVDDLLIKDGGTIGSASAATAITIASSGIVTLVDDLILKDAATIGVTSATGAISISSGGIVTFVDDILIKDGGTIGAASAATAITIASSGIVTLVDDLILKDAATIGVTSSTSAISIASTGIVTFVDDILIKDAGTIGSASDPNAIGISSGGVVSITATTANTSASDGALTVAGGAGVALDLSVGDDLRLISDGAILSLGANSEITATHVHNVGLTITNTVADTDNTPCVLQLKSEEDAVVAADVIASLEFAAGDSDGTDGAVVAAGIHAIAEGTFASDANATKLVFTCGVSETAASSATAKMTLSSAGLLTIADDFLIKDGGTIGVASDVDAIAIASNGVVTFSQAITGQASSALYADLAEMYDSDETIPEGTVVMFAGAGKLKACDAANCTRVAGIVSTDPAYLMNSSQEGVALALAGRVPCKVIGPVQAGDLMVSAGNGLAKAFDADIGQPLMGSVIGKAIEDNAQGEGVIEVLAMMM